MSLPGPVSVHPASGSKLRTLAALALLCLVGSTGTALAWGPLGHRMVAETAARLVERDFPDGWGKIVAKTRVEMGTYSLYPDASFRQHDGADGKVEAPLHYLYLDNLFGDTPIDAASVAALDALPCGYADFKAAVEPKLGAEKFQAVGTAPWRIEQLLALAAAELQYVKQPSGGYIEGLKDTGEAGNVFKALYLLGVMSHYSGDATQPYHATADTLGFKTGQGGVHFYFEFDCVNALEPGLSGEVLKAAERHRARWLADWRVDAGSPAEVLRRVFLDSYLKIPQVAKNDRKGALLAPSEGKKFARRKPAAEGCKAQRAILVERLAKGAVLTAFLWESVLPEGVDWSKAQALQYSDMVIGTAYIDPNNDVACSPRR